MLLKNEFMILIDERVSASNGGSSTAGEVISVNVKDLFYIEVNYLIGF